MQLIRIDRASIKKNPNAGKDYVLVHGPRVATFECIGELPDWLVDDENCLVGEVVFSENAPNIYSGVIFDPGSIDYEKLTTNKNKIQINVNGNIRRIPMAPE